VRPRLLHDGLVLVGLIVALDFVFLFAASPGQQPRDARAYWLAARGDLYTRGSVGALSAYFYSPAFAEALRPLAAVPFEVFLVIWRLALVAALALMSGPLLLFVLFTEPVASELDLGNIHLLLALVSLAGLRYSWLWSFALLTKVTPGIGLLWFVVRGEWRKLAVALGATALIALASFIAAPDLWFEWFRTLVSNVGAPEDWRVAVPFAIRFPVGVGLVVWGARGDRRWTVPVAAMLALPVLWYVSLSMLVGVVPTLLERLADRWPGLMRRWPLAATMRT
jgi:hypothetical protein